jgi:hypothetical protein
LGFSSPSDRNFRALLKLALQKNLVKIIQGGFLGDSMHHPKLVILLKPFEEIVFIKRAVFPSYNIPDSVEGYRLTKNRTGYKRLLKTGDYSCHEWWFCKDCGKKIRVGQPYASTVDFSVSRKPAHLVPVLCKCISCFLNLVEEIRLLND